MHLLVPLKYFFADEPSANLDSKNGHLIEKLLFDLNKQNGTTLVLVTHDEQLAKQCQSILHIEGGQLEKKLVMGMLLMWVNLALKLFTRELRRGELTIIFAAIALAVLTVFSLSSITERIGLNIEQKKVVILLRQIGGFQVTMLLNQQY